MNPLDAVRYVPALRTRRAELRGLSEISEETKEGMLPIFELTRSRRSKSNPEGAVAHSVEELISSWGDSPFICDVTSLQSLTNREVEALLEPSSNFEAWRSFVRTNLPENCVPVVHLEEPFNHASFDAQLGEFLTRNRYAALRVPSDFVELDQLSIALARASGSTQNVILLGDVGMVLPKSARGAVARAVELSEFADQAALGAFGMLASSFPSSVTQLGGDEDGEFELQERKIFEFVSINGVDTPLVYGDYASIHPIDLEGMAVNWVPRVDVPLDRSVFYYRYRRDKGGYVRAAQAALDDGRYVPIKCWADRAIREAASGDPPGRSPAFWISCRVNLHLERQSLLSRGLP